jgi:hypothetical protein
MNYLRQYADERGEKATSLRLYADWCLHPHLDRKGAEGVLRQIEDELRKEMTGAGGSFSGATLANAISLQKLRVDIQSLLGQAGIDSVIVEAAEAFTPIKAVLFEELTHKPLKLSNQRIQERTGGLAPSEKTTDYMITSLFIEPNTEASISAQFQIVVNVRPIPPHPYAPNFGIKAPI